MSTRGAYGFRIDGVSAYNVLGEYVEGDAFDAIDGRQQNARA